MVYNFRMQDLGVKNPDLFILGTFFGVALDITKQIRPGRRKEN